MRRSRTLCFAFLLVTASGCQQSGEVPKGPDDGGGTVAKPDGSGVTDGGWLPDAQLPPPQSLEAEEALLEGGAVAESEHPGFSGTGYAGGFIDAHKGQASVTFAPVIAEAGPYRVALRYANGTGSPKTLTLVVDGASQQLALPATADWDSWSVYEAQLDLAQGQRSIAYRFGSGDSGNVNLDRLDLAPVVVTPPLPTTPDPPIVPPGAGNGYAAESGFVGGGASVATTTAGFEGTGYVTGLGSAGARLVVPVWALSGGERTLTVRYANPTASNLTVGLSLDGLPSGTLTFAPTQGWSEVGFHVTLAAGLRSIGFVQSGTLAGELAIDSIAVENGGALPERGAAVPYREYELEEATTTGAVFGPSRELHTAPAEASGRRGVRLDATGEYVEWTLDAPANALVLRASIPDSPEGTGTTATLALYANGQKVADLPLTSRFAWVYGAYPYDNQPSGQSPQRYFDEARARIGDWPAGTVLRLQKDPSSSAPYYDLDLVDAELVGAPAARPAGYLSIADYGATANDGSDDKAAFDAAIAAARAAGTGVWIPEGTFHTGAAIAVEGVAIRGAGPWHSTLAGLNGRGGFYARGGAIVLADLAIFGEVDHRVDDPPGSADGDKGSALEGKFGSGSLIQNVWIEHTKVGLWADSGTSELYALGLRIRDTYADGVNLHGDVQRTRVEHSVLRNTGDDALAMWSAGSPVVQSAFAHDTVQVPLLGNGIGIYGGDGNRAEHNLVLDTLTASAGIAIGNRFNPVAFRGEHVIADDTLVRTGGYEPNWHSQLGALWVFADGADITEPTITVRNLTIRDSLFQGILMSFNRQIRGVSFEDVAIEGAGTYGIEISATGTASFSRVTVSGAASGGMQSSSGFVVQKGAGNSGF